MYKVSYYMTGSNFVSFREFETFNQAVEFSNAQPINSILEIKHYDNKASDIQNKSNIDG